MKKLINKYKYKFKFNLRCENSTSNKLWKLIILFILEAPIPALEVKTLMPVIFKKVAAFRRAKELWSTLQVFLSRPPVYNFIINKYLTFLIKVIKV